MKYVKNFLLLLTVSLIASCATSGNYCDIAKTLNPSRLDTLTEGTKRQLLEHNLTYEKVCK